MSSDSFSEAVSSLMLHIDSTIASLAAGTTAAGADTSRDRGVSGAPFARGSQPSQRPGNRPQQQQAQAQEQQLPLPLPSFSFGASSSSSGFSSAMAGNPARPVGEGAPAGAGRAPAAASGGGDSSVSAAGGLSDGLGSSLGFSGVSSNTPTDSSTQRYVQQVLLGVLSSSAGATGTTAATGTTGSPDLEAVSSRRQHDASAGAGSGQAGVSTSAAVVGSRQHPISVAAAATYAAPRQQQQRRQGVRHVGAPTGGLLSPESTGASESVSVSSGDTEELLAGVSSGSVTIGPTSSSSSAGSGAQQHQVIAAAAAAHRAQQQQQLQPGAAARGGQELPGTDVRQGLAPRAATAGAGSSVIDTTSSAMQGTSGAESFGPGFGSFEGLGVDGSGSVTAITSALRAAAEVRPSGASVGELLSPDSSSASEGASRGPPHAASGSIAAATAAGVDAAGSSRAAAGGMRGAGVPAVPVRPQAPQQQQQQGAGGGVGRPVGLAGLLADIVSDDPVLARQLQQQQR